VNAECWKTFPNDLVDWNQHFRLRTLQWKTLPWQQLRTFFSSWEGRWCGYWTCRTSVDGVCVHIRDCSLAHCLNGVFSCNHTSVCRSTARLGMQSPWDVSPAAMTWVQIIWHAEKGLCSFFWALKRSIQVTFANFGLQERRSDMWVFSVSRDPRLISWVKELVFRNGASRDKTQWNYENWHHCSVVCCLFLTTILKLIYTWKVHKKAIIRPHGWAVPLISLSKPYWLLSCSSRVSGRVECNLEDFHFLIFFSIIFSITVETSYYWLSGGKYVYIFDLNHSPHGL